MTIALRAQITIDLSADDFVAAADHQRRIEQLMHGIASQYSGATLEIKERRPFTKRRPVGTAPIKHYTGRLRVYEDS